MTNRRLKKYICMILAAIMVLGYIPSGIPEASAAEISEINAADFFASELGLPLLEMEEIRRPGDISTPPSLGIPEPVRTYRRNHPFYHMVDEYRIELEPVDTNELRASGDAAGDSFRDTPGMEMEPRLVAVTTNRFIIRYRDNQADNVRDSLRDLVASTQAIELSAASALPTADTTRSRISSDETDRTIEGLTSETNETESVIEGSTSDENETGRIIIIEDVTPEETVTVNTVFGDMELLILERPMLPSEFARTLDRMGLAGAIEYIQPDFPMSLASLDEPYNSEINPASEENGVNGQYNGEENNAGNGEGTPGGTTQPYDPDSETDDSELEDEDIDPDDVDDEDEEDEDEDEEETPVVRPSIASGPVIVAVIDTSIDIFHGDIADFIVNGWNFPDMTDMVYDSNFPLQSAHGTHVAGIIAATARETGADIRIMPLQVFKDGRAYTSDIIAAIEFAVSNGASVINMSFGSTHENPALREVIENTNALFVSAVGNNRSDMAVQPSFPAGYMLDNVISVASTNADDGFSFFSNYGRNIIDIAARGRDVQSAFPGGRRGTLSGTSMSAARVSGTAAAIIAQDGKVAPNELKERLIETSDRLSNLQSKVIGGRRLNLENALYNSRSDQILTIRPADDFDIHGYRPTAEEQWELFSAGDSQVIQVETGYYHSLALKDDGSVWAWGNNLAGQLGDGTTVHRSIPTRVIGLNDVVSISGGEFYSLAVKSDGSLWAWGANWMGQFGDGTQTSRLQPVQIPGLSDVAEISAGGAHTLAIMEDRTVWAWGNNNRGQLGDGTTTNGFSPLMVGGISNVAAISAGESHSLALDSSGNVWAWGHNDHGQLGDGGTTNQLNPGTVDTLENVTYISAGIAHSLAIREDGTVWAWGWNVGGRLGDGTMTMRTSPVQAIGITNATAISAGGTHSIALLEDGTVMSWGLNSWGQLGNGNNLHRSIPGTVNNLVNITSISTGDVHSLAIQGNGAVWAWGLNESGALGDGTTISSNVPVRIMGEAGPEPEGQIRTVSGGVSHNIALDLDGAVWAWGRNNFGQLGDGTTEDRDSRVQIDALSNITLISSNGHHTLALTEGGSVWSWGFNFSGQAGDSHINKLTPTQVSRLSSISAVSAGYSHSLAATTGGSVYAWGHNDNGQLGQASSIRQSFPTRVSGLSGITDVAAGGFHSLALRDDGTVWAWGDNTYGQLGSGIAGSSAEPVQVTGLEGIIQIAAGGYHSLALRSDGIVYAWGWNGEGQLGNSGAGDLSLIPVQVAGLSNVSAISAGGHHSLALRSNEVWGWGHNGSRQLQDNAVNRFSTPFRIVTLTGSVSIDAGERHTLAVNTSGEVLTLGA